MKTFLQTWIKRILLIGMGGFILIQFIPVNRSNPPVTQAIQWDSVETQQLADRACMDCHSNETMWPWYSYVAPVSWLVSHDVVEGREYLNFSEWDKRNEERHEILESVGEGEMPPPIYLPTHPEARLTATERQALYQGLQRTLTNDPPKH
jgi:hypothetical protein